MSYSFEEYDEMAKRHNWRVFVLDKNNELTGEVVDFEANNPFRFATKFVKRMLTMKHGYILESLKSGAIIYCKK